MFENIDLATTTFAGTDVRYVQYRHVLWPKKLWRWRIVQSTYDPTLTIHEYVATQSPHGAGESVAKEHLAKRRAWWLTVLGAHNTTADEFAQPETVSGLEKARRVCRDLKAALEGQRDYADAGDFYYAEMELKRRQQGPIRSVLYFLYWLTCGYGEKPLRAFVVFFCFWLALGAGFTQTWFTASDAVKWRATEFSGKKEFRPSHAEAMGHALRSLTLQQRSSYLTPFSPWAVRLTLAGNTLGPIQLGLFFLAMRRRFRR